jgi:hypothetical protein
LEGNPPFANVTKQRAIAARKQALRDITAHPSIDAAATPDDLKLAGLEVLNG